MHVCVGTVTVVNVEVVLDCKFGTGVILKPSAVGPPLVSPLTEMPYRYELPWLMVMYVIELTPSVM